MIRRMEKSNKQMLKVVEEKRTVRRLFIVAINFLYDSVQTGDRFRDWTTSRR